MTDKMQWIKCRSSFSLFSIVFIVKEFLKNSKRLVNFARIANNNEYEKEYRSRKLEDEHYSSGGN